MMLNYKVENEICHEFTFPSVQGIFPEILQQSVFRKKNENINYKTYFTSVSFLL